MQLPIIADRVTQAAVAGRGRPGQRRLPPWLKKRIPVGDTLSRTTAIVARSGVATVCQEAMCPNRVECWSRRAATFMILGDRCTRRCHYCAVQTARPDPPAEDEPERLARAAAELGLRHVVITAVARDDLPDQGAGHFARCVRAVRRRLPAATIEVLPADFQGRSECVGLLADARPDVYNHNLETVERLTPVIRPQGKYGRSLEVLRLVKRRAPDMLTKSGLMVGLGESRAELYQAFGDLRDAGCDILTIGQYLQPSPRHAAVVRFVPPDEFQEMDAEARALGFLSVAAGPFVRSSYNADVVFAESARRRGRLGSG